MSKSGKGLLHHAASGNGVSVVEALAVAGDDLDHQSEVVAQGHGWPRDRGSTALMIAARAGHLEASETLLRLGAEANAPSSKGLTPLLVAVFSGAPVDLVTALLDASADTGVRAGCMEACSVEGGDALYWAREMDRTESIPLLEGSLRE